MLWLTDYCCLNLLVRNGKIKQAHLIERDKPSKTKMYAKSIHIDTSEKHTLIKLCLKRKK